MPSELEARRLLTPAETAAKLNLSLYTLQNWRSRRFGPRYIKAGRRVMYRVGDVETFLDGRTVTPSDAGGAA